MQTSTETTRFDETTSGWSAGLSAVIGAEWFPVSYIGVFAEYGVAGGYSRSTLDTDSQTSAVLMQGGGPTTQSQTDSSRQRESTSSGWGADVGQARFGVSLYF